MDEVELDEKALEAAAIELADDDARPWSNMPDEVVCGYRGRDAYRERAAEVVRAYLRTAGLVSVPVLKEGEL